MTSLKDLAAKLRTLPKTVAIKVPEKVAPSITGLGQSTFAQSEDAYGVPWAPAVDGSEVTLVDTGALRRTLRYVPIGTRLRCALGVPYAKYQIGKRPVFPRQGAPLPADYVAAINTATGDAVRESLGVTP
jgi:hypothetical protein